MNDKDRRRFWNRVDKSDIDGCWIWRGYLHPYSGYGAFSFDSKRRTAHRVAWIITYGSIDSNLDILHMCDNPACVNPYHLRLGTHSDNMRDMIRKHRRKSKLGSASHKSKLTEQLVIEIRNKFATNRFYQWELAKEYNVAQTTISAIIRRETWQHI